MILTPASGVITLEQMLLELTTGGERVHRLIYVVARGKRKGELSKFTGQYGAPKPRSLADRRPRLASDSEKRRKTHLESGTLPMTKFGSSDLRTLILFNIIRYNGKQVV